MKSVDSPLRSRPSLNSDDSSGQVVASKQKLERVQACRGAAALFVLLFHLSQLSREKLGEAFLFNFFSFGDAGVNFFFVLSGFIIVWVHHADLGQRDRAKSFLLKRLIRIYPIYWLIALFIIGIYALFPAFGSGYERSLEAIIQSLLLFPQNHLPILVVAWSLSHEVLFYLIFSLAIVLKPGVSTIFAAAWLILTVLLSLPGMMSSLGLDHNTLVVFIFSCHNLEFFLGGLSAYWVMSYPSRHGSLILLLGCVLGLISGLHESAQSTLDRVIWSGIPSAMILVGAASLDLKRINPIPRFFSFLGDASYSIYLIHYPYLSATLKLAMAVNLSGLIGQFATLGLLGITATLVGCLIYFYLENPLVTTLRKKLLNSFSVHPKLWRSSVMRILFLDQSGNLGGAELWLLDIAKPYHDRALVALFTDGPFKARLEHQEIPVQVLANQPINVRKDSSWLKGLQSVGQLLPLSLQVARLSRNYDLIYANTQKALVVGALASLWTRRPLVYHLHDILSPDHFSPANRSLAIALANRFASQVIATSHAAQQAFVQAGGRADITSVVYNGFDPQRYQSTDTEAGANPTQIRQQLGLEGRFVVGHFSRLSPWKGQHVLLEAIAQSTSDVVAIFVGDALYGEQEYVQQLHRQVVQLGLEDRVRFLGFCDEIVPLMQSCDLIAHTSTAPEPFGRVIVEAMLCGIPVVASAAGGAVELVESGVNGWLVPPGEPEMLARAIANCRDRPHQSIHLAKMAKIQASQRFNLLKIQSQLDDLLNQILISSSSAFERQERLSLPLFKSNSSS